MAERTEWNFRDSSVLAVDGERRDVLVQSKSGVGNRFHEIVCLLYDTIEGIATSPVASGDLMTLQ